MKVGFAESTKPRHKARMTRNGRIVQDMRIILYYTPSWREICCHTGDSRDGDRVWDDGWHSGDVPGSNVVSFRDRQPAAVDGSRVLLSRLVLSLESRSRRESSVQVLTAPAHKPTAPRPTLSPSRRRENAQHVLRPDMHLPRCHKSSERLNAIAMPLCETSLQKRIQVSPAQNLIKLVSQTACGPDPRQRELTGSRSFPPASYT